MITILSPFRTPRLQHVFDFVFGKFLGCTFVCKVSGESLDPDSFVIAYGLDLPAGARGVYLHNGGLCAEKGLRTKLPELSDFSGLPMMFPSEGASDFPCDLFSLVFFILSRYEEYLISERDEHGRFCAADSLFHNYLDRPFLDEWLLKFEEFLVGAGAIPEPAPRKLLWANTIDMDIAYSFRGRKAGRMWGGMAKDLIYGNLERIATRTKVLWGGMHDPFDTYDFIAEAGNHADENHFFVLSGGRSRYDIGLDIAGKEMVELIKKIKGLGKVGLHPSFRSTEESGLILKERNALESALGEKINGSRQHFLRFHLPETYLALSRAGITSDYSMGYHDRIGFRSGTAYPHLFFDPISDTAPGIRLFPLHAMDSAMKVYMGLDTASALRSMQALFDSARATGGIFTTVWHNHSLADKWEWKNWKSVYQGFVQYMKETRING